jgi:Mlc titration factor MtfA (ptsG expression regulator)
VWFRRRGLPDGAEELIARHVAHWRRLDADEQAQVLADVEVLLRTKHWEAAAGFALDDRIRLVIAAQAALLVLGIGLDHLAKVRSIIVFPSGTTTHGERHGPGGTRTDDPMAIDGLAQDGYGPIIVAWDQASYVARHPGRGHNVVLHELAHKIDMLDGIIDGTPSLPREDGPAWVEACTSAYRALRRGDDRPPLDPYGATDPGEFFAVATEAFFDQPLALQEHEPALYDVLARFYRQDPALRAG